jgi:hypothetical protein
LGSHRFSVMTVDLWILPYFSESQLTNGLSQIQSMGHRGHISC